MGPLWTGLTTPAWRPRGLLMWICRWPPASRPLPISWAPPPPGFRVCMCVCALGPTPQWTCIGPRAASPRAVQRGRGTAATLRAGEHRCAGYTHACACQRSVGSCPLMSSEKCDPVHLPLDLGTGVGSVPCGSMGVSVGAVGVHLCACASMQPPPPPVPSTGAVHTDILTCVCTWSSCVCFNMQVGVHAPSRASLTHACTVSRVAQTPWPAHRLIVKALCCQRGRGALQEGGRWPRLSSFPYRCWKRGRDLQLPPGLPATSVSTHHVH